MRLGASVIFEGLAGSGTKLVIGENTYMYGDTDGRPLPDELQPLVQRLGGEYLPVAVDPQNETDFHLLRHFTPAVGAGDEERLGGGIR